MLAHRNSTDGFLVTVPVEMVAAISSALVFHILLMMGLWLALVRHFNGSWPSNVGPMAVSVVSLTVSSLPSTFIVVDIFIVSSMKDSAGYLRSWASQHQARNDVLHIILCCYYASYGLALLATFFFIPLAYFYYDDATPSISVRRRLMKASGVILMWLFGLLALGITSHLLPDNNEPHCLDGGDGRFGENMVADSINPGAKWKKGAWLTLGVLRILGMVVLVSLVARGIATGPLRLLRGYDAADPPMALDAVVAPAIPLQEPVDRGQQPNESYESAESSNSDDSTPTPSLIHSRSLQILVGTVGLLVGAFLFACLFMSNTWRAMNSFGLRWGFVMPTVDKVNPLERFFIVLQNFFPLNYIVWFLLAGFLICCARSSVHHSSSRLTCFKVFRLKMNLSKTKSLLVMTATLTMVLFVLDVLLVALMPQYSTYGSQVCHHEENTSTTAAVYPLLPTPLPDSSSATSSLIDARSTPEVLACAWDVSTDQCIKTGIAIIGAQLAFHCRHCSTVLHCLTWVFLVAVICEATLYLLRFKTADSQVEELPN